jgi:hypothetical protein
MTPVAFAGPGDQYLYDQPGDKNYISNTNVLERYSPTGSNNQSYKVTAPRAQADAVFTTESIVVDGIREVAWDAATPYQIANTFNAAMTATTTASAQGTFRLLWDGPILYVLVEVTGDSTKSDTGTPTWSSASYTPTTDGLFVNMDVFNDQWGIETDTQGVFFLPANPAAPATSFNNSGIPSLGSFFNASNQDYSARLNASRSSGYIAGDGANYTYEIALQIEGWGDAWDRELTNGTKIGLELGIFDQGQSFTYWSKTQYFAGREGSSNLPNSERVRNRDWGEVTLSGWDEVTPFAYSGWRADEDIRFWDSKNNPGATGLSNSGDNSLVWTEDSKVRMIAAKEAYKSIKDSTTASREEKDAAVLEVCQAFAGLKWGDTRYPDPHDLPALNTLPNVWEFFDKTKGTDGMVTNPAEWSQRKQEILELAQFYEYGYKPKPGVDYTISLISNTYSGTGKPTVTARVTPTNANFTGGVSQDVTITVTLPTAGVPEGQRAPVAFSGGYTANGIADITFPNWAGDNRTDAGAWGNPNRTGTFYTLFPYSRNSTSADVSIEMANATAVSVYLDILEMAVAENPYLDARIDPSRAVTKGFSINGKIAFVAAVFDERVKAVVTGGAGATGPANWRYNAQGQEYNFSNTIFYNPGAEYIIAHGTEGPGNSYRHNRVRETELFRHFLPYGHMYAHEDGSYGYGSFSRLPFDQTSLVATLAPDRAIIIDTNLNDYNDGAVTDNMSLQIAKSVYTALGVNGDNYVKFNSGNYVSSGDPHGAASATPEGHYLSDLFYGTTTLTGDEASRLNTDPYNLNVSDGQTQSPYDYYWGGFNTITGGTGGISGTDGWYYYTVAVPPEIVINVQPAANMNLLLGYGSGHSLSVRAEGRGDAGVLSYQWYANTENSNTGGTPVDGATSSTYEIPTSLGEGVYYYYAVVTSSNGAEQRTSSVAKVTVRIPSADASLKSVAINITSGPWWAPVTTAYFGTPHDSDPLAYDIVVPYGTNLDTLAATAFEVVANDPGASVGNPVKFDSGARWMITINAEDGVGTATYTIYVSAPFIPVTSITGVPSQVINGADLRLSESLFGSTYYSLGTVEPANASNKSITWSLSDTTNASIVTSGGGWNPTITVLRLASTAPWGTEVVLTATIANGTAPGINYIQNFTIYYPSPVNTLADLAISTGMLSPSFEPNTTDYHLNVPNSVTTFNVTPVLEDLSATITVNGEQVNSGQNSQDILLNVGENPISIIVTAEDGTPKTYTVTVNRLPYDFTGFLPPLEPSGSTPNIFKIGKPIYVKFRLVDIEGNSYPDATAKVYFAKISDGVVGEEMEAKPYGSTNTGNLCTYDLKGRRYSFIMDSRGLSRGIYQIRIDLGDGFTYIVMADLR